MAEKEKPKVKEREFISECIQLYRELPCLWNIKSKEYHDRDKKQIAYETLMSKYKEMFPQASKDDVKKKLNSLRTNYRKELKKHLQSMKSGSSTDDIYEPTLWYFKEMVFLQDQESASDSQSTMDTQSTTDSPGGESERSTLDNNTQEDTTTLGANQGPSTSYAVPKSKAKNLKRKNDKDDLIELAANRLREKPDGYQNWALSCAADLKKMEPTQQIFAKSAIAAVIMEGQLGLLHRNSVKINTPTVTITPSPTYTRSTPTPTMYSSTPSPQYYINYSQQQNSEVSSEQLPHNQQNMHFQQNNQQNIYQQQNSEVSSEQLPHNQQNMHFQQNNQQNIYQQENDDVGDDANEDPFSKYILFNK